MQKIILTIVISIIGISCQYSNESVNKVEIAEEYINALNESDYDEIITLFKDSVRLKELVYSSAFSKEEYYHLFQWDSTFHPTYKILSIQEENGAVRMKVSKECTRILFLNEEPNVTDELVRFEDGKINSIEITNYVVFNEEKWEKNRADLVSWVEANHPELNGFLYDQTKKGALKYLEALRLYQENMPGYNNTRE